MPTYQFVVEVSGDGEVWMPVNDEAFGSVSSGSAQAGADAVLEDCLGDVAEEDKHGHWRCVVWEGKVPLPSVAEAAAVATWQPPVAVWSVVTGPSPAARAVEPGPHSITIPRDVLEWAAPYGLGADPETYLLVTLAGQEGPVDGEQAWMRREMPQADADRVTAGLTEREKTE